MGNADLRGQISRLSSPRLRILGEGGLWSHVAEHLGGMVAQLGQSAMLRLQPANIDCESICNQLKASGDGGAEFSLKLEAKVKMSMKLNKLQDDTFAFRLRLC